MTIAVNTRFLNGPLEGFGYYIKELMSRITRSQPGHRFIFIYDRPPEETNVWPTNVEHVVVGPAARHPVLWKLWYDYRVPPVLKKSKADVFVSPDGFCSLNTAVPQLLVIHDLDFIHHPAFNRKTTILFYRHFTPRFIAKARELVTVSRFSEKDILEHYPAAAGKLNVVYNGVRQGFKPLDYEEKKKTRERITSGQEYFLYAGSVHPRKNIKNLLRAFSIFKRRQKSGLKLVIAGRFAWMSSELKASILTYKYRDDVVLTGYLPAEEFAELMASAYAFVYPSLMEGFGLPVAEAMACGVAVITSEHSAMQEICGENALYADPRDPASIAAQMMCIYKDEALRDHMAGEGPRVAKNFDWNKSAAELWECITRAAAPIT